MRLVRRRSRRPELVEKLQLEKVIGLTSSNGNGLACNSTTGDLAYLAGCVVVVFSAATSRQTRFFMVSRTPKALACVAYSPHGGKLIAAGECGHQPAVIVWDASDGSCLAELKAHKYGVSCVQFSPNGKHLLSVGFPHDGQICLFDFKSGTLISKVRATTASAPISEIHFASDGSFFVTAGTSQLKHWTMGLHAGRQRPGIGTGTHTLDGRNVNLGSLRESSFVAVASSEDSKDSGGANEIQPIYALTSAGILCLLHRGLAIKKWVNLKVRQAHSLCISGLHIACACSDGIVRIFMIETLAFAATLPRPAPLGFHDLTDANTCAYLATHNVNGIIYPDAVACRFATPVKLAVVYADHSFFIWDVQSFSKVERCQSFLSHSGCIWDAINLPAHMIVGHASTFDSASFRGDSDGQGAFATCSSDGSIRLWCIDSQQDGEDSITNPRDVIVNPCNVYDKNTSGVLYQDKRGGSEVKSILGDHGDSIDLCKGFRSISVSLDGQYLAAGDRSGNLHIYDLHSLQIISLKEAHDAEILTLSFGSVAVMAADNQLVEVPLLASGGRDRLVHIYDASKNFEVIETLDDHSASVTAAKFACNSSKLLSSSADKSVVFRNIESNCLGFKSTRYHQEMASRGTIYDMDIDPYKKMAVTVGQDKKLNFLNLASGKSVKSFKPEGESGEPIKVRIDPSGTCLVCSHSDKSLRIYDISNGDLLSSAQGHAEVITGVVFMPDCKRLISVSGDSCIFVWKLPSSLTKMMRKRCTSRSESQTLHTSMQFLESNGKQDDMSTSTTINKDLASADDTGLAAQKMVPATPHAAGGIPPAFKFSVSRLPHWAQAKVSETIAEQDEDDLEGLFVRSSESRWVERLGPEGYKLFCESQVLMPPATVLPTKFGLRRRFTIEPSGTSAYDTPESSLESQRSGTSASSPKVSGRKDNHWKTVHTLFFDEEEYLEDDASSNRHLLIPLGNDKEHHDLKDSQTAIGEQGDPEIGSKEDSIVVYLSDDEQKFTVPLTTKPSRNRCNDNFDSEKESTEAHFQTPVPLAGMENSRNESTVSVFFRTKQSPIQSSRLELTDETQCLSESLKKKNFFQRRGQGEQFIVPTIDEISDDDDSEQHFSPDSDLFNSHFGNLSTAIKFQAGQASARSSFSARFFAQANHPLPILSLFQDSPGIDITQIMNGRSNPTEVGTTSGSLLATERESLKLQERQDSMAMEVQCMQDHLAHLGIVTAEIGKKLIMGEGTVEFQPIDKPQQLSSTIRERILSPGLGISHVVEPQNDKHIFQPNSESSALNCAILLDESDAQGAIESVGWKDSALHTSQVSLVSQSTSSSISHTVCEVLDAPQSCDKVQGGTYLPFSDRVAIEKENKTLVNDRVELKSSFPGRQQDIVVDDYRQCGTPVMEGYNGACPDVPRDVATGMVLDTLKACDPVDEFKKALQDLSQTVDKALTLYKGLDLVSKTETGVEVANLSSLYEEFIPPTLQKVWLLSDSMTSSHQMREYNASAPDNLPSIECLRSSCSDHCSLRLSSIGINSRPCTAAFFSPTSSALKSIDIEGFIQNYSVRFSETLASQVLALVQKGLSAEHE